MSDFSPEERAMFRRARHDFEPSAAQQDRNARALATRLGIGVGTLAGSLSAGSASAAAGAAGRVGGSLFSIAGKWVGIGLLVGAGVGSGAALVERSPAPAEAAAALRAAHPLALHSPARANGASSVVALSLSSPQPVEAPARAPTPRSAEPSADTREAQAEPLKPSPGRVSEEARLLRRADQALQSGSASYALELLDELALRFPDGVLTEERSAERVLTLCQLGKVAQARQEAARFLRATPSSPLASRVSASCAGANPR